MICNYDLYDISEAFIIIRQDILKCQNIEVVEKMIQVLSDTMNSNEFSFNSVRDSLASINNLNREVWYYVFHKNFYVHFSILKNKKIYQILISICELLKAAFLEGNQEKIYDLVDCVHCLPNIIAENNFTITKSYWKSHVLCYREKWGKNFLKKEQKALKNQ